ncbi:MAG: metal ABC transporter ATP-binding protein [Simkaniaceae bacterium]
MKKKPVAEVENLTVHIDRRPILWDINFSIPSGSLVGIIGPNGAGKSTLLKSLLQLIRPLSGRVKFFGQPYKKVQKQIAYVPQKESVDWDFPTTVFDVALMGRYGKLGFFKWPRAADMEAAKSTLEMLGLLSMKDRQISQLSGGQKQRLFLARALLQEADLYLLDEPFAGVDLTTEKMIIDLFKQLKSQGKTVVVVHHDLNSVEEYFDQVIILNTRLVAVGSVEEAFRMENIQEAFGKRGSLLNEAVRISQERKSGLGETPS